MTYRLILSMMLVMLLTACQESGKSTSTTQTENESEFENVCIKAHQRSVSCGWPIYFPDGTRIDNEDELLEWQDANLS